MTPAKAIQQALAPLNKSHVAELVEEDRVAWLYYLSGKRSPSAQKVVGWLSSLDRAGRPVVVVLDGDGASAAIEAAGQGLDE